MYLRYIKRTAKDAKDAKEEMNEVFSASLQIIDIRNLAILNLSIILN